MFVVNKMNIIKWIKKMLFQDGIYLGCIVNLCKKRCSYKDCFTCSDENKFDILHENINISNK